MQNEESWDGYQCGEGSTSVCHKIVWFVDKLVKQCVNHLQTLFEKKHYIVLGQDLGWIW